MTKVSNCCSVECDDAYGDVIICLKCGEPCELEEEEEWCDWCGKEVCNACVTIEAVEDCDK